MRLLSLLALLLFLTSAVLAQQDRILEDPDEDEADQEDLDPDDLTPKYIGERCGIANPCAPGLDCLRVPLRKRCYPVTCGVQAVRAALKQTGFDLAAYGKNIMNMAGVNRDSDMFRSFPGPGMSLLRTNTSDFKKMTNTIKQYQPPVDVIVAAFNNCTGGVDKIQGNTGVNATNPRASTAGMTPYFGASWELGLLGTYNADIFWGQGTADPVGIGLLNNCFGAVLGYDAGLSGLLGMAFTGAIADLSNGCKQMFPIAEFPPFGLQLGFIMDDIPTFLMEFAGGASAGVGLPGSTTCTTTLL